MCGVLHNLQSVTLCNCQQGIHVTTQARKVHRHDSASTRGYCRLYSRWVDIKILIKHIHHYWDRTKIAHYFCRCSKCVTRQNNFITWLNTNSL
ncbi:hypothetical protein D3C85_1536510 [compost metagenome]